MGRRDATYDTRATSSRSKAFALRHVGNNCGCFCLEHRRVLYVAGVGVVKQWSPPILGAHKSEANDVERDAPVPLTGPQTADGLEVGASIFFRVKNGAPLELPPDLARIFSPQLALRGIF